MRWTWVAWACCLLPVLAGCGSARHAVSWVTSDTVAPRAGAASDEARRTATAAWPAVTAQHPRRAFTDEFRDGFVDGYADALDRGAAAQAPAVPPVPYERYKKYFGPDGHALVQDYYLGFQYGTEAAPATARRPADGPKPPAAPKLASGSPKLEPRPAPDAGKFGEPLKTVAPARTGGPWAPDAGDEKGVAVPPLPKPELPVIKPFSANLTDPEKFAPLPPAQDRLPIPHPPLPTEELKPVVPVSVPTPEAAPFPVLPPPGPRPGTSSDFSVLPPRK